MENAFSLKPSLLLGVSSSAAQADGGDVQTNWTEWCRRGHTRDGADPSLAAGHWDRWREDVLLMRKMGIQTCRFSVEWARIEPEEGCFDESAIAHIKEELMFMLGLGIKPLITLHYFTDPVWFDEKGGWADYDNVRCFLIYVEKFIKSVGHLAEEYITLNAPGIYAYNGYVTGAWPPGQKSLSAAFNVMSNMAAAHIKAYRLIHDMRLSMGFKNTKVSFANHMRVFEARSHYNPIHRAGAAESQHIFQDVLTRAMTTGEFKSPLKNNGRDRRGAYCDFHAVNYYTRSTVALGLGTRKDGFKNDIGEEIYPQGIVECCRRLQAIAPLPIYITENGVCDVNDSFRCRYIYEHLKCLTESRLPVKRYYYRSFTDGFEWLEGNYARYGLVGVNADTMERSVKKSGEFYAQLLKNRGVTEEMYESFVSGESYHY